MIENIVRYIIDPHKIDPGDLPDIDIPSYDPDDYPHAAECNADQDTLCPGNTNINVLCCPETW